MPETPSAAPAKPPPSVPPGVVSPAAPPAASVTPEPVPSPAEERAKDAVDGPSDPTACPCEPRDAAWRFTLPLELGQGAAWNANGGSPRYIFTPQIMPGVSGGAFHLNLVLGVPYRNPGWNFAVGGRVGFDVVRFLEGLSGIDLDLEGTYIVPAQNARVSGGVRILLGRLLHIGPRLGYDFDRKDYFLETTIGVDLAAFDDPVGALIGVGPMRDYRDDQP